MDIKNKIKNIIMKYCGYADCDNCNMFDIEDSCQCSKDQYLLWSLSEQTADKIVEEIIEVIKC